MSRRPIHGYICRKLSNKLYFLPCSPISIWFSHSWPQTPKSWPRVRFFDLTIFSLMSKFWITTTLKRKFKNELWNNKWVNTHSNTHWQTTDNWISGCYMIEHAYRVTGCLLKTNAVKKIPKAVKSIHL